MRRIRAALLLVSFFALIASGQQRVDSRNLYERIAAVLQSLDPERSRIRSGPCTRLCRRPSKRPQLREAARPFWAYLCAQRRREACAGGFVARDRAAFQQILADTSVKSLLKARQTRRHRS